MTYQQGFPSPPRDEYRESLLQSANDEGLKRRLYEAAPNLNLFGLKFGGGNLDPQDRLRAAQLGIDTGAITDPDLFSFGKWKALDAIKPKERAAQLELPMVKAAEDRQFKLQQYQIDRQEDMQRDAAQMQFDFGSKMAKENLQGAKELAEQQGKLNLRQSILDSAKIRAIPTMQVFR